MNRALATAAVFCLSACSGAPVSDPDVALVDRWIRNDQAPARVEPIALWYGHDDPDSVICGEIVAPPALQSRRASLRFVYGPVKNYRDGQVELHELWVPASGAAALLDQNRVLFDSLWGNHCAGSAPISRRIAAITGLPIERWWSGAWAERERSADDIIEDMHRQQRASEKRIKELEKMLR